MTRVLTIICFPVLLILGFTNEQNFEPLQLLSGATSQSLSIKRNSGFIVQQSGVRYNVSPPSGAAPLTVTFNATSANGGQYTWTFPNGSVSNTAKAKFTFYRPGDYNVRLNVRFPNGATSQGEVTINALDAGAERAKMIVLVDTGTSIGFDARSSVIYAPFDDAHWDFGDGTSADGLVVRKNFAPGQYKVQLEVKTSAGVLMKQMLPVRAGLLSSMPKFETEVLRLTNDARVRGFDCETKTYPVVPKSLSFLRRNSLLDVAARAQSAAMALSDYFAHESKLDGSHPADRATAAGYVWSNVAENIAAGQPTPAVVVLAWLKSHGHCVNIMDANLTEIGVSHILDAKNRPFWTQVFGRPKTE